MAQPYLTFQELRERVPDRTGEFYGAAIRSTGETVGRLISDYKQAKENDLKGIISPKNDINQITNSAFRLAGIDSYNKFKDKWLPLYEEQRARFSSEQRLEMQNDIEDMQREVEFYNMHSKYIDNARKKADGVYTSFDSEAMDEVMNAIGSGDTDKLNETLNNAMKTNSGTPFLKINPIDSDKVLGSIFDKYGLKTREVGKETIVTEKGGRKYTDVTVTREPTMTPDQQRAAVYSDVSKMNPNQRLSLEVGLEDKLTPEEQAEAMQLFPESDTPLTAYAIEKRAIENQAAIRTERRDEPVRGTGREVTVIEPTERGYSFGSNTVRVSDDIEYTEDGETKKKTFKGAEINGVKRNPDGSYVATAVVSSDPKEIMRELIAEEDAIRAEETPKGLSWKERKKWKGEKENRIKEVQARQAEPVGKYKTIEIPLESVYNEIKDKMEDRGIVLRGFDEITFDEDGATETKAEFVGVPKGGF